MSEMDWRMIDEISSAYEAAGQELKRRIAALIPEHPAILEITNVFDLYKVPGFACSDLQPSLAMAGAALSAAKSEWRRRGTTNGDPAAGPLSGASTDGEGEGWEMDLSDPKKVAEAVNKAYAFINVVAYGHVRRGGDPGEISLAREAIDACEDVLFPPGEPHSFPEMAERRASVSGPSPSSVAPSGGVPPGGEGG
jgi:hypothetical protein